MIKMLDDSKKSEREDLLDSLHYFTKAHQLPKEFQPGTRNFEILCRADFNRNAELKCIYHHAMIIYFFEKLRQGASVESIIPVISLFYGAEIGNYLKAYLESQNEAEYVDDVDDSYSIEEIINDIESTIRDYKAVAEQDSE